MLYRVGRTFFGNHPQLLAGPVGTLGRLVPRSIRHGREYSRIRRLLARSQWWPRERLEAFQLEKLRETVQHAYTASPYYRELFERERLRPEDLRSLEDIRHFPTLTKEEVRENLDRMIPAEFEERSLMHLVTGGTTGSGLVLPFEERYRNRERGFVWHLWETAGYKPRMLAAILRNRDCPPDLNDGIWYMDKPSNAVILSAHHLGPDTIGRYLEVLERRRPKVLIAYPSLAHLLIGYARDAGWSEKIFDLVLLASETLYQFQERELEAVLQAPVRTLYGHVEGCALFGYCERSSDYHVQLEYGHVEFLKEDDSPAGPGEVGEIVATNFENRVLPLVRYRTGDLAEPSARTCSCGRQYPLVEKIEGRQGDYIQTPSGRRHSPTVIEFAMDKVLIEGCEGFADLQIVQQRLDELLVKVVPGKRFTQNCLDRFCEILAGEIDHECRVRSEQVAEIPRTARQKKLLVLSELPPD
jgi:phenylacetate-CoA ligase